MENSVKKTGAGRLRARFVAASVGSGAMRPPKTTPLSIRLGATSQKPEDSNETKLQKLVDDANLRRKSRLGDNAPKGRGHLPDRGPGVPLKNLKKDDEQKPVSAKDVFEVAASLGPASLQELMDKAERLAFMERFMQADIPKWKSVTRAYTAYDHFQDYYREWSKDRHFDYEALYEKDTGLAMALTSYASRHKLDLPEDLKFIVRRKVPVIEEAQSRGIFSKEDAYRVLRDDPREARRYASAFENAPSQSK